MAGTFIVVVSVVIERDGHVLLLRRSLGRDHAPGEWEPVTGRVEQGESPLAAAQREAREETGLEVDVLRPFDTFHFFRGPRREEAIGITFHARATGGAVALSDEHDEARWVPLAELLEAPVGEPLRRCFAGFLALVAPATGGGGDPDPAGA